MTYKSFFRYKSYYIIAVCITFRAHGLWEGEEHACAQVLDACAAIHGSFEGFQAVDCPSAWPLLHSSVIAFFTASMFR
jgi:hypothetical protein